MRIKQTVLGLGAVSLAICGAAALSAMPSGDRLGASPAHAAQAKGTHHTHCAVSLVVLGVGQDAGIPQIGIKNDPAWSDPSLRRFATSIALVDKRGASTKRWLFEATPDMREQVQWLDSIAPVTMPDKSPDKNKARNLGLDGIFLTHAHIGHYAGLIHVGREAASTKDLPVYAMPKMANFLRSNGPWEQLVTLNNIAITTLAQGQQMILADHVQVMPWRVPHRDEYSETVGYVISGPQASALFIPDIDSWDEWQSDHGISIAAMVKNVDYAFVDATFFDNDELKGRDISDIPHPRVTQTMELFADAPADIRKRIHFIHFNHSNALRNPASPQSKMVRDKGFSIAEQGKSYCL